MNKALLAGVVVALLSSAAHARDVSQGTVMVSGNSDILDSSSKTDYSANPSSSQDKTKIDLASLYFVADNIGVGLVYSREDTKTSDPTKVVKSSMNAYGPGVGYNVSLNQDFSLLLHTEYLLAKGSVDPGTGISTDLDGHGYQLGGVLNYFVNESVAISLSLVKARENIDIKYSGATQSAKYSSTSTSLGMSVYF